jgi:hypothetical protein
MSRPGAQAGARRRARARLTPHRPRSPQSGSLDSETHRTAAKTSGRSSGASALFLDRRRFSNDRR